MNNKDFDWGLIPSFLAALDHGSLLAAARATRQSQPTLGRHVAELESQLSLVLFERSPFQSDRMVIDISGDGSNNSGRPAARIACAVTRWS